MPNRLAGETSPYLLQHAHNPVDWYPWGEEALARARKLDRPIIVSIGYSACHWCHVMERESFEDPKIAELMNERFVPIKVDREERPDVDAIYMEAVQAMTGHGGWPLNAFLTPDQTPFYAGTYFPPEPRQGMPSWRMVLDAVAHTWSSQREDVIARGERMRESLGASARLEAPSGPIEGAALDDAVSAVREAFDQRNGGFGGAPKFPPSTLLEFLLARGEREMSLATLRAMARGGIYDQVGGGFSRYAVDATWTVPHFEKMLYDNAQLALVYLHGWQASGEDMFARVCTETLDFVLRELAGPEGGFYSALDADSEGVEGRFYVWTPEEIRVALGAPDLAEEAIRHFGVTERGNFDGANVLEARGPAPDRLPEIRCKLFGARSERTRPALDDKRITAWNALAISALAQAGAAMERDSYLVAARRAASFVLRDLRTRDGRLLRTWKDGRGRLPAYLEDHALLLDALLDLYEATFEPRWFTEACALADLILSRFADPDRGGFFTTADDHERLAVRRKDLEDTPLPSGSSATAVALLRLARLTGSAEYEDAAVGVLALLHSIAVRHPLSFGTLLRAIDLHLAPPRELAVVWPGSDPAPDGHARELLRVARRALRPHLVLAGGACGRPAEMSGAGVAAGAVPLLEGRDPLEGRAAAYLCERFTCRAPVGSPGELAELLDGGSRGKK